jgi:hypothetical protein
MEKSSTIDVEFKEVGNVTSKAGKKAPKAVPLINGGE